MRTNTSTAEAIVADPAARISPITSVLIMQGVLHELGQTESGFRRQFILLLRLRAKGFGQSTLFGHKTGDWLCLNE